MRMAVLLLGVVLIGCSDGEAARPAARRLLRTDTQAPSLLHYPTDRGEMLVMEVFTRDGTQRCYVWRDSEYRSASMQCPAGDEPVVWESPEPEARQP